MCKKLIGENPFQLVNGKEEVMLMEYIVPNPRIVVVIEMVDCDIMEECLVVLLVLKDDHLLDGFHQ